MSFQISGTGSAYPERVVTNDELSTFLDTSDEWISSRTGIRSRRVCAGETLTDLAVAAGRAALENAGAAASELDLILCATVRADNMTPSMACLVQRELGASCPAFDINAACSGFLYSLDVAAAYFAAGRVKRVLVIAGESMSKLLDWSDRRTCVLFGDGAGAVLLAPGDSLLSIRLTAKGNRDWLYIPNSEGDSPFRVGGEPEPPFTSMNGAEVYKFAVTSMCRDLRVVIREAGLRQEDVDYVLPHQANRRIIEAAKKHLHIPPERFRMNIDRFGNTSSAGIPILLDELNRSGTFHDGDILALSAFGGGLTTGACVLRWKR